MSQIKNYILAILLTLGTTFFAQNSISQDPEAVSNRVNYFVSQAQIEVDGGNYFSALKKLEEALTASKSINDQVNTSQIYTKIGKVYYLLEENDKALASLENAISIQRQLMDTTHSADTYKTFGQVYMAKKEYQNALEYFKSSMTIYSEKDLEENLAEILLYEGKAYNQLKDYEKARVTLERCAFLSKKYDQLEIAANESIQMAISQLGLGNKSKALIQALQGVETAKLNNFSTALSEGYKALASIQESLGNYKQANDYQKKYIQLSDSLLTKKKQMISLDQRDKYLIENKAEAQNQDISGIIENEIDGENSLNKLTTILSIALITILSLLTLSLYKNNNIRLKTNNMLQKKNSELIVAKEKAELATKTKANFLSTVTHELRTPLYAVTGITNMLLDEDPKPEQIQHLKSLKFSGEYLLTFINDILQINKIEANKVDLAPEVFNLKKKIQNVISALNNSALDNNIKVHLEYSKDLPEVFNADQLKISQILINLIGNSIKFTKDGDIWVRAIKIGQDDNTYNVRFEVEDNGIGISQEKQDNMFESFSQGSIQINRKYGGTGLGLSIVKGLVDILKGKIYVKSQLGKGSTFTFELPLEYTDEAVAEKKSVYFKDVAKDELSNIKILVVEDNKINQMITKKILNKMNLNCELVDNGEAAVDLVKNNHYDVVLMDIHMPGISGIEATTMIRTFDKELTIFALTAVTIEDKMHEFDEAGFTDIISKPFKQEDFEKKLFGALILDKQKTS